MNLIPIFPFTEQAIAPFIGRPAIAILRGNKAFYGVLQDIQEQALILAPLLQTDISHKTARKNRKPLKSHQLKIKVLTKKRKKIMKISALSPEGEPIAIPLSLLMSLFVFPAPDDKIPNEAGEMM